MANEDKLVTLEDLKAGLDGYIGSATKNAIYPTIPYNLAAGVKITDGKYVRWSTGGVNDYEYYSATDEIDISGCSQIIYTRQADVYPSENPVFGMAFYDSSHEYISGIVSKRVTTAAYTEWYEADVPFGAKYARFTYWTAANQVIPFTVYDAAQYSRSKITRDMSDLQTELNNVQDSLDDVQTINKMYVQESIQSTIPYNLAAGVKITDGKYVRWTTGGVNDYEYYSATDEIDISGCSKIIYTRQADVYPSENPVFGMAFYDSSHTYIPDSGIPSKRVTTAAYTEWYEADVPSGAKYARFTYWTTANQVIPFTVYDAAQYNLSKVESEISAVKKSVEDSTSLTFSRWKNSSCILSTYYDSQYASNNGLMQGVQSSASSSLKASDFIPVYGKMLELPIPIVADTTWPNYGMSLYDANYTPILGRAVSCIPNRSGNTYVAWIHVYLPKEAKYFRTTYWTDSSAAITGGYAPAFSYNLLAEIPDCWKPITHELPVDTYMQNAIRRARQITDIKWTPRVNIPRYCMLNGGSVHFLDWFYEDKEYLGIPYSGALGQDRSSDWTTPKEWGYAHMWVGQCVPFEAFVTAARFPNSIFSETVDRTSVNYSASPFGIVCTSLVNYAVDGPLPLRIIPNFFDTADAAFRKPSSSNTVAVLNANDYEIGDFLYTSEHVIIITDLKRDSNGNVTHIEMSEATTVGNGNNAVKGTQFGGVARRKMWEFNEFKSKYSAYVKYRKTSFYGIDYTPNKFVDTGDEGPGPNVIDYACIPYLGNSAVYRVGYIVNTKILIGATGWTKLIVQKDGASFGTFDVTGLTEVSVGFSAVGNYEAWLTNQAETSRTMSCTWSVVSGTS